MSKKNSTTTSDYLEWDTAMNLVHRLYNNEEYRMSAMLGCGFFCGLRFSDLRTLTWAMLLDADTFNLVEKKTGKKREIRVNRNFQKHLQECFNKLGVPKYEKVFLSQKKTVYSIQRMNIILKNIKDEYELKINHFSTHSFRKTFGRKVVESASNQYMALIKLSELFNHSDASVTRRYLGLRREELLETYDLLSF